MREAIWMSSPPLSHHLAAPLRGLDAVTIVAHLSPTLALYSGPSPRAACQAACGFSLFLTASRSMLAARAAAAPTPAQHIHSFGQCARTLRLRCPSRRTITYFYPRSSWRPMFPIFRHGSLIVIV